MNIDVGTSIVPVKLIGRGSFSTVWRSVDNPDIVFIKALYEIDDEIFDYAKVTLEHVNRFRSPNVHIPTMEEVSQICTRKHRKDFVYTIYQTTYSEKLTPDYTEQWKLFETLVEAEDRAWSEFPEKNKKEGWASFNYAQDMIDMLEGKVPDTIIKALDNLYIWGGSICGDLKFDFKDTNFRVRGEYLLFTDPVHNPYTYRKHMLMKRGY